MRILFEILITLAAYMLFPFIYFYALDGKMSKGKIKLFNFINSIVVMLIFTAIYVFLEEDNLYSGAPALLYWFINNAIYTRYSINNNKAKSKEEIANQDTRNNLNKDNRNRKTKMKNNKDNKIIIISICVVIAITIISGSVLINTYIKLENKDKNEIDRQDNLYDCITDAKSARTSLWDSNCTKQKDGSCTIDSDSKTIDWIEKRYQQDLNSCYQLYGN